MFSGNRRGTGLDIDVAVQDKAGRQSSYKAVSDRYLDYTKWNKIAVRFQDSQSLIRIFVNNTMVKVLPFSGFASFPADAQIRLAQLFEVYLENTGTITSRFKVSCVLVLWRSFLSAVQS